MAVTIKWVMDEPETDAGPGEHKLYTWSLCSNVDWNPESNESAGFQFARELIAAFTGEDGSDPWTLEDWESEEWDMCHRIAGECVYTLESRGTWQVVKTWADLWNGGPALSDESETLRGDPGCEVDIPAIMSRDLDSSAADFLHYLGEEMAEAYETYRSEHGWTCEGCDELFDTEGDAENDECCMAECAVHTGDGNCDDHGCSFPHHLVKNRNDKE
jgi:hypothetical protein